MFCKECANTGSRDKLGTYLDCNACGTASMRRDLNDFVKSLGPTHPEDVALAIHQRALAMAPKKEAPALAPVAYLVFAEDHNGMVPQHPAYSTHLQATRCASMFGQTPTEIRPLYDNAAPAAANGALPDEQINWHAKNIYGTAATAQEIEFAKAILAAAGPDAALTVMVEELLQYIADHDWGGIPEPTNKIDAIRAALSGAKGN